MSDTSRGRERIRRIVLSAGASALSRGIAFAGSLVTIPIALNHLGEDRFGLWVTIVSLLVTLNFADLGIGNGLITTVADASARGAKSQVLGHVSSATTVLGSLAIVGISLFLFLDAHVRWGRVFNASTEAGVRETDPAMLILAVCLLIGIPLSLAQKVHIALQEAFLAHVWSAIGSALAIAGVITAVKVEASLPWLVLAAAGGPVLAALLNWFYLFFVRHPELRPRWRLVTKSGARAAFRRGMTFLLLGVSGSVAYQADHIIISRVLGADAVSDYAVPLKLFFIAPTVLGFVLLPLWPAYSEAIANGDLGWVKAALRRSVIGGIAFTAVVSALLVAFARPILHAWVGDAVDPSDSLLLGMGLWAVVNGVGGPVAMFLNGTDQLRFLVVVAMIMAATNLVLSILLTRSIGVAGPVFASVITQVTIVLIPSLLWIRRIWSRLTPEGTPVEPLNPTEEISAREYRLAP